MSLRSLPLEGLREPRAAGEWPAVRRAWRTLALLYAVLIAHVGLYLAQPDKQGGAVRLFGAVMIGLALASIAVALWLSPERLASARRALARLDVVYAGAGLLALAAFGLVMRPELVYAHAGLMLAATFALGYHTLYNERPIARPRLWIGVAVLLVLAVTFVRAYGLQTYPYIENTDEPWSFGRAFSFYKTGQFSDWIQYYGGHDTNRYMALMALWMRLVGAGFWQARMFSLLMTFPVILVAALAARNLYGRRTALFTAGVLFSAAVLMEGVRTRHDLGITLAIALSLWVYTEAVKRERGALHLLAGALIGWGWFGHYHAVVFGAAMTAAFYLPEYARRLRRGDWRPPRAMLLYIAGGLLGALTVFLVQIVPEWQGFLTTRDPRIPEGVDGLVVSTLNHVWTLAEYSFAEFILLAVAVAVALWRRRPADIVLLLVLLFSHIGLGVAARYRYNNIPMPLAPVYAILIASLFGEALRRAAPDAAGVGRRAAVVFAGFMLILIGGTVKAPLQHLARGGPVQLEPNDAAAWVRANVPAGSKITAENRYFFWLLDYRFISPVTLRMMPPDLYASFPDELAIWDDINPEVVILDPNLSTYGYLHPLLETGYLARRGYEEVATFPGEDQPIRVFRRPPAEESEAGG